MWIPVAQLLVLMTCVVPWGCCRPDGAPAESCVSLSPSPTAHNAEPQTTPVPYEIVLDSALTDNSDDLSYIPGDTYTCKFIREVIEVHMILLYPPWSMFHGIPGSPHQCRRSEEVPEPATVPHLEQKVHPVGQKIM